MPATTLSLHTPWPRALWQSARAAVGAWLRRPPTVTVADLPPLDDRMLRDMGLPDWLRHDVAERRQTRAVERIANGLPVDGWR
jgi:uncharacterized protein YjiS (DUF1127 family)